MAVSQIAIFKERISEIDLGEALVFRDKPSEQVIGVPASIEIIAKLFVNRNRLATINQLFVAHEKPRR
jgi:hypothetical protein